MAKVRNAPAHAAPAAPEAPEAPQASIPTINVPEPPAPPAPPEPTPPVVAANGEKKSRQTWCLHPTPDAAVKDAASRDKGATRAFSLLDKRTGREVYCVAANETRAGLIACLQFEIDVHEIGKAAKAPKSLTVGSLMEAILSMPEDQRATIMAQLSSLGATK